MIVSTDLGHFSEVRNIYHILNSFTLEIQLGINDLLISFRSSAVITVY